MTLPAADASFVADRHLSHEITVEGGVTCIVFPCWNLPPGFDRTTSALLIRLPAGYPDVPIDMWWFDPPVQRSDGQPIEATQSVEYHLGRQWQRWSRHLPDGQWRGGIDGLESFLALVRSELLRSARQRQP